MKFAVFVLAVAVSSASAQAQRPTPEPAVPNLPIQRLGPNDLIGVSVYDSPELTRTIRISADGMVRLPILKRPILAAGRMPADLERAIAEALVADGLIVDPLVTVTLAEYNSRPISVAGSVKSPLTFQAVGPVTLLEAITRAGGLSPYAGGEILVTRASGDLVQRITVKSLMEQTDSTANVQLTGGEQIRIPEVGKIFVIGNVRHPGAYPLQGDSKTTILQAIALAEGLSPNASNQAFVFRRDAAAGSKNEIPVELKRILDRKAPDPLLAASDILYVPDNHGRRLGLAALEKILLFGSTAGATALVWRY